MQCDYLHSIMEKYERIKGDGRMRTFFGGKFIEKEKLVEAGIQYPIKLEYYKKINEDQFIKKENAKFGIAVVKTEYIPNNTKIENKEITYLSNDEQKVEKILRLFKENEVTPIGVEDVLADLSKELF